jgi:hypothetical protein
VIHFLGFDNGHRWKTVREGPFTTLLVWIASPSNRTLSRVVGVSLWSTFAVLLSGRPAPLATSPRMGGSPASLKDSLGTFVPTAIRKMSQDVWMVLDNFPSLVRSGLRI